MAATPRRIQIQHEEVVKNGLREYLPEDPSPAFDTPLHTTAMLKVCEVNQKAPPASKTKEF